MVETRSGDLGDVVGLVPQRGKPLISPATTVAPNCGPNDRRRGPGAAGGASTVRSLFMRVIVAVYAALVTYA
jgi:hypothetical protein